MNSFCAPDNLIALLHYLVDPVPADADSQRRYRNPYVSSEMLVEDIPQVREALMDPQCLELLFGFIERPEAIEPLYARNVCRVFHNMLCQFGKEVCSSCCLYVNMVLSTAAL
jgi:hypothetical protein